VTIAILDNVIRYVVGTVIWGAVVARGSGTELGRVVALFRRDRVVPASAS
jgi:hypothetical protein